MPKATNATSMHLSNRSLILDLIRRGDCSRAELAEQTKLTRAAITMITEQLISEGIIKETVTLPTNRPGRNYKMLALNGSCRYIFGVTLYRTFTRVGVIDIVGNILTEEECDVSDTTDPQEVLKRISDTILMQIKKQNLDANKVLGIGVSAPGPLDYRTGVILNPPNFDMWRNVPVADTLCQNTGFKTRLENLSNALALEQKYFGVAKEISDYAIMIIIDGIGSGVVINNKLYRGFHGLGNEIGHTTIQYNGRQCECGNYGCLEKYASIPALLAQTPFQSWMEVVDSADSLPSARYLLDLAAQYLSASMITAFNLYDLEKIILLGDVCYRPEALLQRLNRIVCERAIHHAVEERGELVIAGNESNPVRAAAMSILYAFFSGKV